MGYARHGEDWLTQGVSEVGPGGDVCHGPVCGHDYIRATDSEPGGQQALQMRASPQNTLHVRPRGEHHTLVHVATFRLLPEGKENPLACKHDLPHLLSKDEQPVF